MNIPIDEGVRAALLDALHTPALPAAEPAADAAAGHDALSFEPAAPASAAADPGETLLALDVWAGAGARRVLQAAAVSPAAAADSLAAHVMQALA
jgi:hypothetical protein